MGTYHQRHYSRHTAGKKTRIKSDTTQLRNHSHTKTPIQNCTHSHKTIQRDTHTRPHLPGVCGGEQREHRSVIRCRQEGVHRSVEFIQCSVWAAGHVPPQRCVRIVARRTKAGASVTAQRCVFYVRERFAVLLRTVRCPCVRACQFLTYVGVFMCGCDSENRPTTSSKGRKAWLA